MGRRDLVPTRVCVCACVWSQVNEDGERRNVSLELGTSSSSPPPRVLGGDASLAPFSPALAHRGRVGKVCFVPR